jgi:hypothetical protein
MKTDIKSNIDKLKKEVEKRRKKIKGSSKIDEKTIHKFTTDPYITKAGFFDNVLSSTINNLIKECPNNSCETTTTSGTGTADG